MTILEELELFIQNEIPERRDYSASKTYEIVLEEIDKLKKKHKLFKCENCAKYSTYQYLQVEDISSCYRFKLNNKVFKTI